MKLIYIIYVAAWLSNAKLKREHDIRRGLIPFLIVSGIIAGLLILQPATSTVAILLGSGLVVYFASGAPKRYLVGIILLAVFIIAAVVYVTPYRRARILGFLNQSADTQGTELSGEPGADRHRFRRIMGRRLWPIDGQGKPSGGD